MSTKRFRVALSFPGEKRDFIRQVADLLATAIGQERVLYYVVLRVTVTIHFLLSMKRGKYPSEVL